MSNKKAIWASIGLIFVIMTLAIGAIAVFTTVWYTILCGISLVIVIFISDGCKKHLWKEHWKNQNTYNQPNAEVADDEY
jgi:hypothetical protein